MKTRKKTTVMAFVLSFMLACSLCVVAAPVAFAAETSPSVTMAAAAKKINIKTATVKISNQAFAFFVQT